MEHLIGQIQSQMPTAVVRFSPLSNTGQVVLLLLKGNSGSETVICPSSQALSDKTWL
jgi:hypothetical protein